MAKLSRVRSISQNNQNVFDKSEAEQLTAEEMIEKEEGGKKKIVWDSKGRRNEALDCCVYALAALRISAARWQLDLQKLLDEYDKTTSAARADSLTELARKLGGE
ncbi:Bacteriophage tail assembly protein [Klebsiella pneumoniae]|nr:Bacteriophage tail assembly protein [Klebsiella pneumoniae]